MFTHFTSHCIYCYAAQDIRIRMCNCALTKRPITAADSLIRYRVAVHGVSFISCFGFTHFQLLLDPLEHSPASGFLSLTGDTIKLRPVQHICGCCGCRPRHCGCIILACQLLRVAILINSIPQWIYTRSEATSSASGHPVRFALPEVRTWPAGDGTTSASLRQLRHSDGSPSAFSG